MQAVGWIWGCVVPASTVRGLTGGQTALESFEDACLYLWTMSEALWRQNKSKRKWQSRLQNREGKSVLPGA